MTTPLPLTDPRHLGGDPLVLPAQRPTPLVLDSPHSGTHYPEDFRHHCDLALLRRAEDFLVDRLFEAAPAHGAPLICAPLPRSYIDVNRALADLDPLLLPVRERDPQRDAPGVKSDHGMGLLWRLLDGELPIYDRQVSRAETMGRIARCWHPYHRALDSAVMAAQQRHGLVLHVNCHSMPSQSRLYPAELQHRMPYDFLLGDRDGSTADPRVREHVAALLRERGYRVGVNTIFKGVEIVRRIGQPAERRHSLQLEINRALYMDEQRHEAHEGFAPLQALLTELVASLAALAPSL